MPPGPFTRKVLVDRLLAMPKDSDVHVWNDALDGWRPPSGGARGNRARDAGSPEGRARTRRPRRRAPRLRPVPPPPSQAPASERRDQRRFSLRSGRRGAATPRTARGSLACADGRQPQQRGPGSEPASRRWWRRRRRCRRRGSSIRRCRSVSWCRRTRRTTAQEANGAGVAGAAAAAPNAIANGESDALNALNLGGSWRQPSAPLGRGHVASSSSVDRGRHRGAPRSRARAKLAAGAAAAGWASAWCCSSSRSRSRRRHRWPPVPGSSRRRRSRSERPRWWCRPQPSKEVKALRAGDPPEAAGEPRRAQDRDGRARRRARSRRPARAGCAIRCRCAGRRAFSTTTSPGAFTAEQRGDATRFGDSSGRALQIRNPLAPADEGDAEPERHHARGQQQQGRHGDEICYQRALLRDTSLTHGKIDVNVTIGISGRVKSVGVGMVPRRSARSSRALRTCCRAGSSRRPPKSTAPRSATCSRARSSSRVDARRVGE